MFERKRIGWTQRGVVLALWIPLVFTIVLALVAFQGQRAHDQNSRWILHTVQVKDQIGRVDSLLKDVEIGQRGYLLTGNPVYRDLYQNALKGIPPQSTNLAGLIRDNPRQVMAVSRLDDLISTKLSSAVLVVTDEQRMPHDTAAFIQDGKSEKVMDEIRSEINSMAAEEDRLLAMREDSSSSQIKTQKILMAILVTMDAVLIVGLTLLMQHSQKSREDADVRSLEAGVRTEEVEARSSKKILESELRYRRLFETAQDGILILDAATGQVVDANPFMKDLLGYSQAEFLGRKLWEIGPFKGEAASKIAFEELRLNNRLRYEGLPLETKEGRRVEVEFISNIYLVDGVSLIQCNIRDTTERQKAAERTEQANIRTDEANTRTEQANTRTEQAEERSVESLRTSEVRYRRLFETAQDGILILDAGTGQVMDANPFMKDLLGYSQEEFLGRKLWEIGPFKGEAASKSAFAELRLKDRLRYKGLPLETKTGQRVEVEFVSNTYLVDDKQLIQCNIRDLTERQKAEERTEQANTRTDQANTRTEQAEARSVEAILASELRYRRLFETAQDGILILDAATGQVVDANPFMKDLLGYSQEEFLGRKLWEIGPFKGEAASKIAFAELQLKDRLRYESLPLETKDGRRVEVEFVSNAYLVDNTRLIQCNIRDLTERNRSEARFRRLVDSNAQGVLFWNTKGEITGANDAFLQVVGYSREDLENGKMNWVEMTPPKYREPDRICMEKIASSGVCPPYEKEYIRKDGSSVLVLIGAAAFADNPNEGVCFVLDLTERKKLEHQFLRAQRMESIGTLAGGIAHDLNNILAPIVMSIDILKMSSTDPQALTILDTIEVSAKRGTAIVRQVLSFARGVEGERIEVQPSHLLKDLENIIKDTFPKDIRLHFSIPIDTWAILGDPTQVHQVLLNLCVNARDAMPNGGSLNLDVENCVLDEAQITANPRAKPGRYLKISVTHSGTGMAQEVVDKIFEPFFTTKELHKGTGLGLSTVMAIVKSHEGVINVYSEIGQGTTFKIYFPAIEMSSEAQNQQSEAAILPRGNGEQILVIDDEASILIVTSQTLQAFGYRVLTATDGAEGLALYAQHRHEIAAVITDMSMPIMDGAYTIRALTRINPTVKIIAASGLNANDGIAKASNAGIKHFLTKPYTAGTLLTVIRAILDQA